MRVPSVAFVLLALAVAGCNDAPASSGPPTGATSTTGILHGVVVDDAVRPLGAVGINVTSGDRAWNTTTGDDGLFRLTGLEPGTYIVEASKRFYGTHQQAVVVVAGVDDPPLAKFQLVFEPEAAPFANLYKHEGFHECGVNIVRICSNINIITSVVVCSYDPPGLPCFNVTADSSFFVLPLDGAPTFLQSELDWDATLPGGEQLTQLIGAATWQELQDGMADAWNVSSGPSPLMMRLSNHEGESAWCKRVPDPPCGDRALEESRIGQDRMLLGQVDAGPSIQQPACGIISPCGVGHSTQQQFVMYVTTFHGYEPPIDWLFTDGNGVPPPPE